MGLQGGRGSLGGAELGLDMHVGGLRGPQGGRDFSVDPAEGPC